MIRSGRRSVRGPDSGRSPPTRLEVTRNGRRVAISGAAEPDVAPGAGSGRRAGRTRSRRRSSTIGCMVERRRPAAVRADRLRRPARKPSRPTNRRSPIGVSAPGGRAVAELKIYRDVYYTDALAGSRGGRSASASRISSGPRILRPRATTARSRTTRGSGSRGRWCRGRMFLGKPFLVHLPGRVVALEVFGRAVYWIPDPRRIRYIH